MLDILKRRVSNILWKRLLLLKKAIKARMALTERQRKARVDACQEIIRRKDIISKI